MSHQSIPEISAFNNFRRGYFSIFPPLQIIKMSGLDRSRSLHIHLDDILINFCLDNIFEGMSLGTSVDHILGAAFDLVEIHVLG